MLCAVLYKVQYFEEMTDRRNRRHLSKGFRSNKLGEVITLYDLTHCPPLIQGGNSPRRLNYIFVAIKIELKILQSAYEQLYLSFIVANPNLSPLRGGIHWGVRSKGCVEA